MKYIDITETDHNAFKTNAESIPTLATPSKIRKIFLAVANQISNKYGNPTPDFGHFIFANKAKYGWQMVFRRYYYIGEYAVRYKMFGSSSKLTFDQTEQLDNSPKAKALKEKIDSEFIASVTNQLSQFENIKLEDQGSALVVRIKINDTP